MSKQTEAAPAAVKDQMVISHVFNAPRQLVWRAWTESEQLMHWWGPKGVTMKVATLDLRPGGRLHYCYEMPDGNVMWGLFNYLEVSAPERLVYTNAFSDAEGNIVRAPFSADWPLELMNIMTLHEENGKTTLTLRGGPHNPSAAEQAAFDAMKGGIPTAFKGTLGQLEEYLAKA